MNDQKWDELVSAAAAAFRLAGEEKTALSKQVVARFVTGIPFYAKCGNADRIAFGNLSLFIVSQKVAGTYAAPSPADNTDISARFERFSHYPDGDRDVIKKAIAQLSLAMLEDYQRDRDQDKASGQYNPLNEKTFDYNTEKQKLEKTIAGISKETGPDISAAAGSWWSA